MRTLTLTEARRLPILGTRLAGPRQLFDSAGARFMRQAHQIPLIDAISWCLIPHAHIS